MTKFFVLLLMSVLLVSCVKEELEGYEYTVVTVHENVELRFSPQFDAAYPSCGTMMHCKVSVGNETENRSFKSIESIQGMNVNGKYRATVKVFPIRYVCMDPLVDPIGSYGERVLYLAEILTYEPI